MHAQSKSLHSYIKIDDLKRIHENRRRRRIHAKLLQFQTKYIAQRKSKYARNFENLIALLPDKYLNIEFLGESGTNWIILKNWNRNTHIDIKKFRSGFFDKFCIPNLAFYLLLMNNIPLIPIKMDTTINSHCTHSEPISLGNC